MSVFFHVKELHRCSARVGMVAPQWLVLEPSVFPSMVFMLKVISWSMMIVGFPAILSAF